MSRFKYKVAVTTNNNSILDFLSFDKDWNVRSLVAQNPNVSKKILESLRNDSNIIVRRWAVFALEMRYNEPNLYKIFNESGGYNKE